MRRALIAAAAVAAIVVAVLLLARGGDDEPARAAADPAAWIQRDFPVVASLDTDGLLELVDRFPGAELVLERLPLGDTGLRLGSLRAQLAGRAAVGWDPERDAWVIAAALTDPGAVTATGPRARRDGDVLVLASDARLADAAVVVRAAGRGARGANQPGDFLALRSSRSVPELGLGAVTARVALRAGGLHGEVAAAVTDPRLLPVAEGPQPPRPAGRGPITLALRDPRRALDALGRRPGYGWLGGLRDALRRYARQDLGELLTGTATVTRSARATSVRAELTDGDGLRRTLDVAARVPAFVAGLAGLGEYDVAKTGGRWLLTRDELPVVVIDVEDDVLVVSTDPHAATERIARARPAPASAIGAAHLHVTEDELVRRILERFGLPPLAALGLEPLGALTGSARAGRDRLRARFALGLQ